MNEVQRVKTWIIRKHLALGRHLTILRTGETETRRVTSLALSDSHTSSSFFFFFYFGCSPEDITQLHPPP
jgi:hypothetical protein